MFTIGYEGLNLDAFLQRLHAANVRVLVDVRELPLSRKKGFSKTSLREQLASQGIDYVHMPALGCPKPVRDAYKQNADWPEYVKAFEAYMATQSAALKELTTLSKAHTACLMCFEADYNRCHRSMVARNAQRFGAAPTIHITAQTTIPELRLAA